ncbi:hypothetical protein OsJ_00903 [Oryza sativa Japonica Group]|uniref:Uncharacterized protein n=1 Tax=Oryza sativa subsp. japonica TaxID=39947 RepID=B9EU46_ORYSJ|nr:hypothetical protein OsJ_00903 [Oryza sativa Japonica Group]
MAPWPCSAMAVARRCSSVTAHGCRDERRRWQEEMEANPVARHGALGWRGGGAVATDGVGRNWGRERLWREGKKASALELTGDGGPGKETLMSMAHNPTVMASTTRRLAAAAPSSSPVGHRQNRALPMSSPWSTPARRRPYTSTWSSRPSHRYNADTHNARARKPYPYEHLRRLGRQILEKLTKSPQAHHCRQIDYREPGRQAGPEIDRDAAPEPRTGHMGTPNRLGLI